MKQLRLAFAGTRARVASRLAALGIGPNHLTVLGLLLALVSGLLFYTGLFRWASSVLLVSGLCDLLDGEVARQTGRSTLFGAFLDSTLDRFADSAVLGGILLYYAREPADRYVALAFFALVGSLLTSYTRARAESLIDRCDVGVFERPERLLVLLAAGFAGYIPAALWILALAANFTAAQRVLHVRRSLRNRDSA